MKDINTHSLFHNYYFLSYDFDEKPLTTNASTNKKPQKKISSNPSLKTIKDKEFGLGVNNLALKEKDFFKELNIAVPGPLVIINGSSGNNLPNINKFKANIHNTHNTHTTPKAANTTSRQILSSTQKSDLEIKDGAKKLKRTISLSSTNSTNSNYSSLNQKNPGLLKIKSFSNLGNLIVANPSRSINKQSYSSKNLKFT